MNHKPPKILMQELFFLFIKIIETRESKAQAINDLRK